MFESHPRRQLVQVRCYRVVCRVAGAQLARARAACLQQLHPCFVAFTTTSCLTFPLDGIFALGCTSTTMQSSTCWLSPSYGYVPLLHRAEVAT